MPTDPHHTRIIIQPSTSQPQKKQRSRRSKRKDTKVPQLSGPITNVANEAVNEEMDDSLERAATTATSLDTEHDRGNIDKTQSKATLNETSSSGTSLGNTLQSGKYRLKHEELMALCTTLQSRVLALETLKTTQATKIASLKKRVKKLKGRNKSRTYGLKRLYRVGSSRRVESSKGEDGDEVIVESVDAVNTAEETRSVVEEVTAVIIPVSAATTTTTTTAITDVEITLAQALTELKTVSTRPRAKGLLIMNWSKHYTNSFFIKPSQVKVQDKAEEERLAREKSQQMEEANISWDDIQAKIDADYQLAQRLQAQEQDELTDEEKARLTELVKESSNKVEAMIAHESSLKRAGEELE
ncbi:hypothetical protein Tco_0133790 [Tanacetum coccineum]